ncbi:MAG: hypothetical protein ACRYG8_51600 [Janthinobacterium lividum]
MNFIAEPGVNVDPTPYLQENSEALLHGDPKVRGMIFETMLSFETLKTVDKAFLDATGRIRSTVS